MPKQPAKTTRQSAKFREQQLRRRMAAQGRSGDTLDLDGDGESLSAAENGAVTMTYAPAAPAAPVVRRAPPPPVARRPTASIATTSAVRAARGRMAQQVQTMDLAEEMAFIRSDVRRLLILAGAAIVLLLILTVIIH